MKKIILSLVLLSSTLHATLDLDRPESKPNQKMGLFKRFVRGYYDFMGIESFGYQKLKPENEAFIENIIKNLQMEDYCIEIRGMSNYAEHIFGHVNAFVMPSVIFNKKSHTYLYVAEEWFDTLSSEQKEALVKHELMHLKCNHARRRIFTHIGSLLAIGIATGITWKYIDQKCPEQSQPIENILYKYCSFIVPLYASLFGLMAYDRSLEKEADIEATKTMKNKQGMIDLLNNLKIHVEDPYSKFAIKRLFQMMLEPLHNLLSTHPRCNTRIDYINDLQLN